jgi:hypothetical protein
VPPLQNRGIPKQINKLYFKPKLTYYTKTRIFTKRNNPRNKYENLET